LKIQYLFPLCWEFEGHHSSFADHKNWHIMTGTLTTDNGGGGIQVQVFTPLPQRPFQQVSWLADRRVRGRGRASRRKDPGHGVFKG
jgi:hypothetical protein